MWLCWRSYRLLGLFFMCYECWRCCYSSPVLFVFRWYSWCCRCFFVFMADLLEMACFRRISRCSGRDNEDARVKVCLLAVYGSCVIFPGFCFFRWSLELWFFWSSGGYIYCVYGVGRVADFIVVAIVATASLIFVVKWFPAPLMFLISASWLGWRFTCTC